MTSICLFELPCEGYSSVDIAGSFNNWAKLPMERIGSKWYARLMLSPGIYQYKYIVNGEKWIHDQNEPSTNDNYGGLNNSVTISSS